ncbi:MAG: response regulator [Kofleriaceae bacterium]|nr:response regulator [Kofleriaceae bacterium]
MDVRDDGLVWARRRVLIVDDDALILAALERQLSVHHDVVVFTEPEDALVVIRAGAFFDVVLVDLMMPAMSGVQFLIELERAAPALAARTVLMTGGSSRREAMALLDVPQIPTLAKPFDGDTLRRLIDRVTAA